jgi:anti-sigma factor RsiW
MTWTPDRVDQGDLMAYVDGRLASERARAVKAYLAHPDARDRVSQYIEQREALRQAFEAQAALPIPTRFLTPQLVAGQLRRRRRRFAQIAAALCLITLGVISGWAARDVVSTIRPGSTSIARMIIADAIAAHRTFAVEILHPVEVDAQQEAHLIQWLSKRLDRPLIVPDLTATGYRLMGGRLLPAENGPAAELMYENCTGGRLTIYLRSGVAGEAKRYHSERGIGAFYWADEGLGCVVVGETDRKVLRQAATSAYEQTFPDAPKGEFSSEPEKNGG